MSKQDEIILSTRKHKITKSILTSETYTIETVILF